MSKFANPRPSRLLIVGCGYLGLRLGRQALDRNWSVAGTTRNRQELLGKHGIEPVTFDWNDSRDLNALGETIRSNSIDKIVVAVSHDRNSPHGRFASQVDGLSRLLLKIRQISETDGSEIPQLVYISTTGVYHQTGGVWVDETSPTHPTRQGGRAHLHAEAKLRTHLPPSNWTILRLSGIYGPGRVPRAADVQAGRPIASPPSGHLNLIHVDDAAAACLAALDFPARFPGRIRSPLYVVSDDSPVVRREFYNEIARQTRSPEPTFINPASDSGVRFRSETDKRIWNRRLKRDLMPQLSFPSYREGLRNVLDPTYNRPA